MYNKKNLIYILVLVVIIYIFLENIAYCMDYPDHAQGDFDDKAILDRKKRLFFNTWALEKNLQDLPMIDIKRLFYQNFSLSDRRDFNSMLRECVSKQEVKNLVKDFI